MLIWPNCCRILVQSLCKNFFLNIGTQSGEHYFYWIKWSRFNKKPFKYFLMLQVDYVMKNNQASWPVQSCAKFQQPFFHARWLHINAKWDPIWKCPAFFFDEKVCEQKDLLIRKPFQGPCSWIFEWVHQSYLAFFLWSFWIGLANQQARLRKLIRNFAVKKMSSAWLYEFIDEKLFLLLF